MATYVLIHGAGGSDSWYWHLVAPRLRSLGHDVVAPDLPCDDEGAGWGQYETAALFGQPWPLQAWPSVPTRFLLCRDDRFFPADFMRRTVKERLGTTPDELDSGHLPALGHPMELVSYLESCRAELDAKGGPNE